MTATGRLAVILAADVVLYPRPNLADEEVRTHDGQWAANFPQGKLREALPSAGDQSSVRVMNVRLDDLKQLPISERIQLVEDLWDSIARDLESVPLPESLQAEMNRRMEAYLEDPSTSLSLEEVRRRMSGGR